MSSRRDRKLQARAERLAREAELRAAARRKRLLMRASVAAVAVVVLAGAGTVLAGGSSAPAAGSPSTPKLRLGSLATLGRLRSPGATGPLGPEGVPVPDAPDLTASGSPAGTTPVDGIQCLGSEQLLFHIHAHLTLYVNGTPRRIPYGIGITDRHLLHTPVGPFVGGGGCFYWLHTHAADGIIHIESPVVRTYTLGDFFDVWGQKLGPARVGPVRGRVTAIYNDRLYLADPRDIPLTAHAQIQLEVGKPSVAPVKIAFPPGL